MLPALLTTVLFSLSVISGHRSAKLIGGTEANFWRLTCATLFLSVWAFGFGIGVGGAAFGWFFFSGVMGIGLGDVALFQALPRLGSRLSLLLIQCLTAPIGALIEWVWLGTSLTWLQLVGGAAILLGVGVALRPSEDLRITPRDKWVGIASSIAAAAGGAFGAVLSRKAYRVTHDAGERLDGANAAFQRILGGLLIGGICLLIVKRRHLFRHEGLGTKAAGEKWRRVWHWVLANSLAGQTIGVSCMQWALETTPTGLVLAIIATTPIVVIPFAMLFEKERPNAQALLGGAIAVAGVVLLILTR